MSVPPLSELPNVMADVDPDADRPWLWAVEDEDAVEGPSWRVIIAVTLLAVVILPLFLTYCGSL